MSEITYKEPPMLCAEQVEIFVPNNPDYQQPLKKFFDNLMLLDRIPITPQHQEWLKKIPLHYPAPADKPMNFGQMCCWENLVFGYSIYLSNGYFIGVDHQTLHPQESNSFEESTQVIKLIMTNYMTTGIYYPRVEYSGDPFLPTQSRPFISYARTPYFVDDMNTLTREHVIMMLHYRGMINYIFTQLSTEIMRNEQEIWLQSWPTQLSRKIATKKMAHGLSPRELPVAQTLEEKQRKYGKEMSNVLCVIDYATPS